MDRYESPEQTDGLVLELPTMIVNRKLYVLDPIRQELRNVLDPRDRITFGR